MDWEKVAKSLRATADSYGQQCNSIMHNFDQHYNASQKAKEYQDKSAIFYSLASAIESGLKDDENARLRRFAESFGVCDCAQGMCDPQMDFQCRAREALTGKSNIKGIGK